MNWLRYWPYLVGPWQGLLIAGYVIFLAVIMPLGILCARRRQHVWWLRISARSLGELREIRYIGGLSHYQTKAIDWLIDFVERHPSEQVPENPPAEIFDDTDRT